MHMRWRKHLRPGDVTTTGEHCAPLQSSGARGRGVTTTLPGSTGGGGKRKRLRPGRSALAALLAVALAGLALALLLHGLA